MPMGKRHEPAQNFKFHSHGLGLLCTVVHVMLTSQPLLVNTHKTCTYLHNDIMLSLLNTRISLRSRPSQGPNLGMRSTYLNEIPQAREAASVKLVSTRYHFPSPINISFESTDNTPGDTTSGICSPPE